MILTQNTILASTSLRGAAVAVNGSIATIYENNLIHQSTATGTGWPKAEYVHAGNSYLTHNVLEEPLYTGELNSVITADPKLAHTPSPGADGIWGTADDLLDATPRADSAATDAAWLAYAPSDSTDVDGNGNVNENLPLDLLHAPRVRGTAPDAGAFELLNSPPTVPLLSPASVDEARAAGTVVGFLSSTDPNGGPLTYSLVTGTGATDNARFTINGTQLVTAEVFIMRPSPPCPCGCALPRPAACLPIPSSRSR